MSKLISTFQIRFDNETKAEINSLKSKLDEVTRALSVKNDSHGDRLLAAIQAEAANDAAQPELKQMGQWVFEGRDEKFQSAAVDGNGEAYLYQDKKSEIKLGELKKHFVANGLCYVQIDGVFDTSDWENSAIDRETINDVDYLSETVPEIQGMDAREIIIDECDWLSESAPQITQADMQLIFIKNLSETLIQRMHSMNRFSEDDYYIGADKLMAWDIVYDVGSNRFGFITASQEENLAACFLKSLSSRDSVGSRTGFHRGSLLGQALRTIREDEIRDFCGVLEAYHA